MGSGSVPQLPNLARWSARQGNAVPVPSLLDDSLNLLRGHLSVLLSAAAVLVSGTWFVARAFYLQQVTAAKEHRGYVERQLDDAEKRLKELAPQSQATDLAGLVDDLSRRLTATAEAGEALLPNRLVHIAQEAGGRSVVLLADKLKKLEAHGFVTQPYGRGEKVRVERIGQFPLSSIPTRRTLFLQAMGETSDNVDMIPGTIHQTVGTVGPDNMCLFDPAPQVLLA